MFIAEERLQVDQTRGFGCIACGACVAACPLDAIRVSGRDLYPQDIFVLPPRSARSGYESLYNLLVSRRSTRKFDQREVDLEVVQKIIDAASTAPVGIPPSDVGVLVFRTPAAISALRENLLESIKYWPKVFSPQVLVLLRPFIGRENAEMYGNFIRPAVQMFLEKKSQGIDWLLYEAPLVLYFYGTVYNDPADTVIAATLATLAGESLGLGTCMLGFPGYIFQYNKALRRRYGLPKKIQPGLAVIFGYPKYRIHNTVRRRFREVRECA